MTEVKATEEIIETDQKETIDDEERKWCVYCHTNKINGKKYFGITSDKPQYRWKKMEVDIKIQLFFLNAINKYTWDGFDHIIIKDKLTKKEAMEKEIELIALYKTNCRKYKNPSYGYNMTDGGDGTRGVQRFGKDNLNYGNHKLAGKNNPSYGKYYDTKFVYAIELNQIFFSSREAERKTGADHSGIIKSCKNKNQKTCGKHPITKEPLHWKYVYNHTEDDGTIILGAITLGYITEEQVNEYLSNLK